MGEGERKCREKATEKEGERETDRERGKRWRESVRLGCLESRFP